MLATFLSSLPFFATVAIVKIFQSINLIKPQHKDAVVALAFNVVTPALVILLMKDTQLTISDGFYFLIALITWLASGAVGWGLAKLLRVNRKMEGSLVVSFLTFGIGLVAYPLVELNYARPVFLQLILYDVTGLFLLMMTGSYLVATHYGEKNQAGVADNLKTMIRSPLVIAMGVGILFSIFKISIPALNNTLEYIAGGFGLVMSALLGLTISLPKLKEVKLLTISTAVKIGTGIGIGLLATSLFGITGDTRAVILIANASSVGMIAVVFAETEGLDSAFVSQLVMFSLLVSMILAPILIAVL